MRCLWGNKVTAMCRVGSGVILHVYNNYKISLLKFLDSMILLGSIQRPQLQSLLNQHMQKAFQTNSQAESESAVCSRPETPDSLPE